MKNEKSFGVDEVGRGALAGPVVAGVVSLNLSLFNFKTIKISENLNKFYILSDEILITDSKKMTPKQREVAAKWIKEKGDWGVGIGSVTKINKLGIVKAANFAFRKGLKEAIKKSKLTPKQLLIDAFYIPRVENFPKRLQTPIVHGDALNIHIAAASIIAKVYRDEYMKKLHTKNNLKYTLYGWERNKGYGTKEHIIAIKKQGTTKHHRNLFVRNYFTEM